MQGGGLTTKSLCHLLGNQIICNFIQNVLIEIYYIWTMHICIVKTMTAPFLHNSMKTANSSQKNNVVLEVDLYILTSLMQYSHKVVAHKSRRIIATPSGSLPLIALFFFF